MNVNDWQGFIFHIKTRRRVRITERFPNGVVVIEDGDRGADITGVAIRTCARCNSRGQPRHVRERDDLCGSYRGTSYGVENTLLCHKCWNVLRPLVRAELGVLRNRTAINQIRKELHHEQRQ